MSHVYRGYAEETCTIYRVIRVEHGMVWPTEQRKLLHFYMGTTHLLWSVRKCARLVYKSRLHTTLLYNVVCVYNIVMVSTW